MFKTISAVLFDLDDTLLDTFDARARAVHKVFTSAGISDPTAEQFLRGMGGAEMGIALAQLRKERGVSLDLWEEYRSAYWGKAPGQVSAYPGIKALLGELRGRNVRLAVVTQKRRAFQMGGRTVGAQAEIAEAGLTEMLPLVVGFDDVSKYKPHPEGVNMALERLGVVPAAALVVGDSFADIAAGRAAGCWTCHATWGVPASGQTRPDLGADFIAATPRAVGLWTQKSS